MIEYVLGFAFNKSLTSVLLVEKKYGPEINIDKLNGVGGKVDPNESSEDAMTREFLEETGCKSNWTRIGCIGDNELNWTVHVFSGMGISGSLKEVNDVGEPLKWEKVDSVISRAYFREYAQNVPTMVLHALTGSGSFVLKV
jgi:8-oxo-dGTP pyrophosphatase MutT (NUDIX family)